MATSNDSDLKWRHFIEKLLRVLHELRRIVVHCRRAAPPSRAPIHAIDLALFIPIGTLIHTTHSWAGLLTFLEQEGLLVEYQIVEDTREEDTFEHDQVAYDLAREECVLQLLVLDEVVQPLLAKTRHAAHFEEVRGF